MNSFLCVWLLLLSSESQMESCGALVLKEEMLMFQRVCSESDTGFQNLFWDYLNKDGQARIDMDGHLQEEISYFPPAVFWLPS